MLFNVCDGRGKHLGILTYIEAFRENTPVVALTDLTITDVDYNKKELVERLAQYMDAKTILGKVNEAKLEEKLRDAWREDLSELGAYDGDLSFILIFD